MTAKIRAGAAVLLAGFLIAGPALALKCDPENGGLELPDGFCALVVAEDLGRARHLAVRDNGDIYVLLRRAFFTGAVVALRDGDGDGRAEIVERFGGDGGTGVALQGDTLYLGHNDRIVRYRLDSEALVPKGEPVILVEDFPFQVQHAAKSITLDGEGGLYVNVGAPSNACQVASRVAESPGQDPCPQLDLQGGVWKYSAERPGQKHRSEARYATGIRNAVALEWNPELGALFAVQHGRDQLSGLWPDLYSDEENAELPAEEFFKVVPNKDYGWPYCYYDHRLGKKVLAPEYGGDGKKQGRCSEAEAPLVAFPGHWAPNDLLFYRGEQFPSSYRGGAFVAFHGSWNRAPLPQKGYQVGFVPFADGRPTGAWSIFADGFAGKTPLESPGDAEYRPMGLAEGPDGSLYVIDSVKGTLWRILYRPERK